MKINIDGKEIEVKGKKTILEVARENGIYIPSLCDHPHLVPFAGCRLCIVEIKGKKGFLPSCSIFVDERMEVNTKTPRLQKLRKQILGLILSEHPNACLICKEKENCDEYKSTIRKVGEVTGCVLCSNNGRCELQDIVEAVGISKIEFPSVYRNFDVKKNDPFFDRNFNLCILCGRCVRICQEVRGASVLSFSYRGTQVEVGTVLDRPLYESGCQFCGACVDVCPTGALVERSLKYETLPDKTVNTICPLCSIGCELEIMLKEGRILSSKPSLNGAVNQGQACVKGRFTISDLVHSSKRILKPLVRINKKLEEVSWEEALDFAVKGLKKYKGKKVALIGSSQATCEENFLLQKFAREVLRTDNVDSPVQFSPLTPYKKMVQENSIEPHVNFKIEDIAKAKTLFLFREDITSSHPIIWLEVLKAVKNGAKLVVISPTELPLKRFSSLWLKIKPGTDLYLISFLIKILIEKGNIENQSKDESFHSFKDTLDQLDFSDLYSITGISQEELREASKLLQGEKPTAFLFGLGLTQNHDGSQNIAAIWNLALLTQAQLYLLGLESNLRGVSEIDRYFPVKGLMYNQIFQASSTGDIKALYLAGPASSLEKANLEFMIIQDSFVSENLKAADVILPATTFAETEGVFINTEGRIQKLEKIVEPLGEAKPDWWIISQIAQKMGHDDFHYKSPSGILKEMSKVIPCFSGVSYSKLVKGKELFIREEKKGKRQFIPFKYSHSSFETKKKFPFLLIVNYSLDYYRNLSLPQEIKGLRKIRDSKWIEISPEDAKNLGLKEGENVMVESSAGKIKRMVRISESFPRGAVGTSLLWSEDPDFSVTDLVDSSSQESHSLGIIHVNIKRGK